MIALLGIKLFRYKYSVYQSPLYIRSHLLGTIINNTFCLFSLESQPVGEMCPFFVPMLIIVAFENCKGFLVSLKQIWFLLLGTSTLLHMGEVFLRLNK